MKDIDDYKKKLEREMKSGVVSLLILSTIERGREPVYGYQIIQKLKKDTGGNLVLKEGSVYPILHYLYSKGFVKTFLGDPEKGAPRKYYTITSKGRFALKEGLGSWSGIKLIMDSAIENRDVI